MVAAVHGGAGELWAGAARGAGPPLRPRRPRAGLKGHSLSDERALHGSEQGSPQQGAVEGAGAGDCWRAESDLRTLRQAEEIRRDPSRLKRAATMAAEEMKALQAVRAIKRGR